jgi:hypothetical protein
VDNANSLTQEQQQALMNIRHEFMVAEKTLKKAIKEAENCYIINKTQIGVEIEIGGVSAKDALQNELTRSMKEKSNLQVLIEKALEQMEIARNKIINL